MTVDLADVRAHIGPGPSDEVLTDLLAGATEAIDLRYGPEVESERAYSRPFGQWVRLRPRASAVTSVIEGTTTLAESLYTLWPGGAYLRRLDSSGNPQAWSAWVDVVYTPLSETEQRDRVTIALIDLELGHPGSGLTSITVGPWSEQYAQSDQSYEELREAILDSMRPPLVGPW